MVRLIMNSDENVDVVMAKVWQMIIFTRMD